MSKPEQPYCQLAVHELEVGCMWLEDLYIMPVSYLLGGIYLL